MDTNNSLVKLTNISKKFKNGTFAISGFNTTFFQNEFVSILGPSGCGKTTILRLLAGLGKPSEGSIDWQQSQKKIGFVFQEPTLMPWLNVLENITAYLKLSGFTKKKAYEKANESIDLVGLAAFKKSYPRQLSGGMKMRVSIARALSTDPEILLMDEPFAALDEMTRFRLNSELLSLWQKNKWSIVFVTHSIYEAVFLSNRVLVCSSLPAQIIHEKNIDYPYPRDDEFRLSQKYADYCRDLSHQIKKAF